MIVIADTTPINYLVLIGEIEILAELYGQVVIPTAVFEELKAEAAPPEIKNWLANFPDWLSVKSISTQIGEDLEFLDAGEGEAIRLAEELKADLLIMDEKLGRKIAKAHGLRVIGTLGVLALANHKKLINLDEVIRKLENTNFYLSDKLKDFLRK